MGEDSELNPDLESPVSSLGLPVEIAVFLAVASDPPLTVGALLALARDDALGDIKGIGPARKRVIEQSLRRAGHHPGDRPGRQSFLPGRPQ